KRVSLMREPLEKDLKDKLKLGRWEDRSIVRVQENATRSHRHLAKIGRDYEKVLERPITEIIDSVSKHEGSIHVTLSSLVIPLTGRIIWSPVLLHLREFRVSSSRRLIQNRLRTNLSISSKSPVALECFVHATLSLHYLA